MVDARRIACRLASGVICLLTVGHLAWGSPSGLNNIPTTDVTGPGVLVVQTWFNLGDGMKPQQFAGFKYGAFKGLEVGADWKAYNEPHGHVAVQAKYAFDIMPEFLKGVVGVANVSDNRQHNGEVFPYAATSIDLKACRLHLGFAPQPHNEAFFVGIDRTVPFFDRNLQLKADAIQVSDGDEVLFSVGFLYDFKPLSDKGSASESGLQGVFEKITRNIVLEAWVSFPTISGAEEVLTVKLNYVIEF